MIHPNSLTTEQKSIILKYFQNHDAIVAADPDFEYPLSPNVDVLDTNPVICCQNPDCESTTQFHYAKENWIRLFGDIQVGALYWTCNTECYKTASEELSGLW